MIRLKILEQINQINEEKFFKYLRGRKLVLEHKSNGDVYETVILDAVLNQYERIEVLLDKDASFRIRDSKKEFFNPAAFSDIITLKLYDLAEHYFNINNRDIQLLWSEKQKQSWLDKRKGS